jgi:hypothetical protein
MTVVSTVPGMKIMNQLDAHCGATSQETQLMELQESELTKLAVTVTVMTELDGLTPKATNVTGMNLMMLRDVQLLDRTSEIPALIPMFFLQMKHVAIAVPLTQSD